MRRISMILIILLATVFTLGACAKPTVAPESAPAPPSEPATAPSEGAQFPVQDILNAVIESQGKIKTLEFDMNMTMDMAGEAEGEPFEMTTVTEVTGKLDSDNKV
jgi:hypothetical protein